MSRDESRHYIWRRVALDGTPSAATKTALRPHEEENVRAALRLLHARLGTWRAVSKAIGIPMKTIERAMGGTRRRRVQDSWATRVARALRLPVDDVLTGNFPADGRCHLCGQAIDSAEKQAAR